MISFNEFKKVEIKIGTILSAEPIEKSDKLLKLIVDLNEEKPRQIISGISKFYNSKDIINKQIPIVCNLEPKEIFGLLSEGMILAIDNNEKPVLLHPDQLVDTGSIVV